MTVARSAMPPRTERSARTARQYRRLLAALSHNVRRLRARHEWNQEEAAHRSELSLRVYQRVEAGRVNLTFTTLARLCQAFDVEGRELLTPPPDGSDRRTAH